MIIAKTNIKNVVLLFALSCQPALPQIKTGTVIFVDLASDEITIAADSRSVHQGGYEDTECKISAFGNKFVFAMAGMANEGGPDGWDSHTIARKVWTQESAKYEDADKLVQAVSKGWTASMDTIYSNPRIIRSKRRDQPDNSVLAESLFVATDKSGKMAAFGMGISFDISLFDSSGIVALKHTPNSALQFGYSSGLGLDDIIVEYSSRSSPRAAEFMRQWTPQIAKLSASKRRAAVASKLIELSILLHPRNRELGFPIDVLQIEQRSGVHWVSNEKRCPEN